MDNYNEIIKKIDFADECNKEVAGNFGRTMTITMEEAFLFKSLMKDKVVNENCNISDAMLLCPFCESENVTIIESVSECICDDCSKEFEA
jgi:hypothetical protein